MNPYRWSRPVGDGMRQAAAKKLRRRERHTVGHNKTHLRRSDERTLHLRRHPRFQGTPEDRG